MLLWLWCRPAPVALIWPLAWELPYAATAALKRQKTNKQTKSSLGYFVVEALGNCLNTGNYSEIRIIKLNDVIFFQHDSDQTPEFQIKNASSGALRPSQASPFSLFLLCQHRSPNPIPTPAPPYPELGHPVIGLPGRMVPWASRLCHPVSC